MFSTLHSIANLGDDRARRRRVRRRRRRRSLPRSVITASARGRRRGWRRHCFLGRARADERARMATQRLKNTARAPVRRVTVDRSRTAMKQRR